MEILPALLLMLICLLAEGFFSGSEIAVVSADRFKLRADAARGSKGAKLAKTRSEPSRLILLSRLSRFS